MYDYIRLNTVRSYFTVIINYNYLQLKVIYCNLYVVHLYTGISISRTTQNAHHDSHSIIFYQHRDVTYYIMVAYIHPNTILL